MIDRVNILVGENQNIFNRVVFNMEKVNFVCRSLKYNHALFRPNIDKDGSKSMPKTKFVNSYSRRNNGV